MKVRLGFYLITAIEALEDGCDIAIVEEEIHTETPSRYCHAFVATRELADQVSAKTGWEVIDEEGIEDSSPALFADGLDAIQTARELQKHYPDAEFQFDDANDAADWTAGKEAGTSIRYK